MNSGPVFVDTSLFRALAVKYLVFAVMGVVATFAAPPALSEATNQVFVAYWCALLAVSGGVAFGGVILKREPMEMFGAAGLSFALASYAAGFGIRATWDGDAWYVLSVASVALTIMPVWRAGFLFRKDRTRKRVG